MSFEELTSPYQWYQYSKKIKERILHPSYVGFFTVKEAESHEMRLVIGKEGSIEEGAAIYLYWLVDESDGIIADAKFQVFGPPALIAAADIVCQLVVRKTYDQASRIRADLLDKEVRDKNQSKGFPAHAEPYLFQVISAIDQAVHQCMDIPYAEEYRATPIAGDGNMDQAIIEKFYEIPKAEQIKIIEEVVDKEIRPYIELDAGGIEIQDILGSEVKISYAGACVECPSSIGSTLSAIQQILQNKVHPTLTVTPEL